MILSLIRSVWLLSLFPGLKNDMYLLLSIILTMAILTPNIIYNGPKKERNYWVREAKKLLNAISGNETDNNQSRSMFSGLGKSSMFNDKDKGSMFNDLFKHKRIRKRYSNGATIDVISVTNEGRMDIIRIVVPDPILLPLRPVRIEEIREIAPVYVLSEEASFALPYPYQLHGYIIAPDWKVGYFQRNDKPGSYLDISIEETIYSNIIQTGDTPNRLKVEIENLERIGEENEPFHEDTIQSGSLDYFSNIQPLYDAIAMHLPVSAYPDHPPEGTILRHIAEGNITDNYYLYEGGPKIIGNTRHWRDEEYFNEYPSNQIRWNYSSDGSTGYVYDILSRVTKATSEYPEDSTYIFITRKDTIIPYSTSGTATRIYPLPGTYTDGIPLVHQWGIPLHDWVVRYPTREINSSLKREYIVYANSTHEGLQQYVIYEEADDVPIYGNVFCDIYDYHGRPVFLYSFQNDKTKKVIHGMIYKGKHTQSGWFPVPGQRWFHEIPENNIGGYAWWPLKAAEIITTTQGTGQIAPVEEVPKD